MENRMEGQNEDLASRVTETAEAARNKTQEFASATAAKAKDMTSKFGHKVKEFAGKVREGSPHERVRDTTNKVADKLESAGSYLEEKNIEGMIDDVTHLIRRYPMQALLIGIGIGVLLARGRREN